MFGKRLTATLFLLIVLVASASAQTMTDVVAHSMFADKKAFNEGDVITVIIVEFTTGSNQTNTATNSDTRTRAEFSTGGEFAKMLRPFMGDGNLSNRNISDGRTTTRGTLESTMTALVTEVQENGLLNIEGTRMVDVNGEEQTTTLTGTVRPEDVRSDNSVFSYHVANARISYAGAGMVSSAGKPGLLTKIWNWIF